METALFIRPKHIIKIENVKKSQASRIYQTIKDALGKSKKQRVEVEEYAHYIGTSPEKVKTILLNQ